MKDSPRVTQSSQFCRVPFPTQDPSIISNFTLWSDFLKLFLAVIVSQTFLVFDNLGNFKNYLSSILFLTEITITSHNIHPLKYISMIFSTCTIYTTVTTA